MSEQQWDSPPEMSIDTDRTYRCNIETSRGTIELELYPEHAPVTVNNFLFLAGENFYDGTSFHRVISDLMGRDASARFRFIMERAEDAEAIDV